MLGTALFDLRMAARWLRRRPTFTVAAVLTIALAIGANVAVFSVVEAILLRPLAFAEPEQLVQIVGHIRDEGDGKMLMNPLDIAEMRELTEVFEGIESSQYGIADMTLLGGDQPLPVRTERITPGMPGLLGVRPLLGAGFDPSLIAGEAAEEGEEEPPPPRVLISHELWQRAFGGDPGLIGQTRLVNQTAVEIGGVMPPGFMIPRTGRSALYYDVDLWTPMTQDFRTARRGGLFLLNVGRLRPGVTVEQARARVDAFAAQLRESVAEYGEKGTSFGIYPLHAEVVAEVRAKLFVLMGAVSLLLLLACGNVASLLLARTGGRRIDMAVMAALGCARRRLAVTLLAEALILATIGGLLGLGLGWMGARVLESMRPPELPDIARISMNWSVVAYACLATGLATVLFGMLPAVHGSRTDLGAALRRSGLAGASRGTRRSMRVLVMLETAVSMTLLLGALLLVQTLVGMAQERPGFDLDRTMSFQIRMGEAYRPPPARAALVRELQERLGALPGVAAVGVGGITPFSGGLWNGNYAWDEESLVNFNEQRADFRIASPGYFAALGTRLLAGRLFTNAELEEAGDIAIVDETLARRAWPDEDPIGKRIILGGNRNELSVVGVVEHVREVQLHVDGRNTIYFPYGARPGRNVGIVVGTTLPPGTLIESVRRTVTAIDSELVPARLAPLRDFAARSIASTRFVVLLLAGFAVIALILAVIGLYGVLAYSIRLRFREIGIRMALGAQQNRIFGLVAGEGVLLTVIGLVLGAGAALALGRFLRSLLFGISATDPTTFVAAAAILLIAAVVAASAPARRASRTDPVGALRAE